MPAGVGYGRKATKRKAGGRRRRPFGRVVKKIKAGVAKRKAGA